MYQSAFNSLLQLDLRDPDINPTAQLADIGTLLGIIVPLLMTVAAFIFGGMLLLTGYKIITAAGEPEKIQEARQTGTFAVIGILIVISAFLIVRLLAFMFQLELPF